MLISERRYPVHDGFLGLHNQMLAPLSLNEGQAVYVTAAKFSPFPDDRSQTVPEIILSPFAPALWDDLWRVRIQFTPGFGRFAALTSFLNDRKVKVLSAEVYEGGDKAYSQFNRFHLIVSAHDYASSNDGDVTARRERSFARLEDLEDRLAVRFIDDLYFHDRRFPRLTIRRLTQHRVLARDKHVSSVIASTISCRRDAEGRKELGVAWSPGLSAMVRAESGETPFLQGLMAIDPGDAAYVMPTADIEERFIRIITPTRESPFHFIKFIGAADSAAWRALTEAISRTRGNMVKLHLRTGIGEFETGQVRELCALFGKTMEPCDDCMRANITFSFEGYEDASRYVRRLYAQFAGLLGRDADPGLVRDDVLLGSRNYDTAFGGMWIFYDKGDECLVARVEG
ncbi:MAG: hypothetical protein JOZ72_04380 [Alphaproteobacteria bacterium]|nr:hypothetical protein [Alphaproteobacteria bacterium]